MFDFVCVGQQSGRYFFFFPAEDDIRDADVTGVQTCALLIYHTDVTMKPGEPLYIGMDFNVGKMAAVVHVKRDGLPRAVDEIIDGYDTPDMIRRIKER